MKSIKDMRKWMNNQEKSKLFSVENYNLTFVDVIGYLLLILGLFAVANKVFTDLKPYGWGAMILGFILICIGVSKKEDKDIDV